MPVYNPSTDIPVKFDDGSRFRVLAGVIISSVEMCIRDRFMGIALVEMIPEAIGFWIITGMSFVTMCVSTIFTVTLLSLIHIYNGFY